MSDDVKAGARPFPWWGWLGVAIAAVSLVGGSALMAPREGVLLTFVTAPVWVTLVVVALVLRGRPTRAQTVE